MITTRFTTLALALAMGATAGVAHAANDGTIAFTGKVTSTTCKVEGGAPGQGDQDVSVDLGSVSVANLAASGDRSAGQGFTITIGGTGDTGCVDGQTARIRFDPASSTIDPTTGRLKLDATGTPAKFVEIEIANGDGTPINLFTEASKGVEIKNNQAIVPLVGRYYATGAAEAGDANSRVSFQVAYD